MNSVLMTSVLMTSALMTVETVLSYDVPQARAASVLGLEVAMPGSSAG